MAHPYMATSVAATKAEMLAAIGASSIEDLFAQIPPAHRLLRPLQLKHLARFILHIPLALCRVRGTPAPPRAVAAPARLRCSYEAHVAASSAGHP